MHRTVKKIICFSFVGIILVIAIALNVVAGIFADIISTYLSTGTVSEETRQAGKELAVQIQEEGSVLVRNEDSVLPLNKEEVTKVNVFGWSSTQWVVGGSGSGQSVGTSKGLIQALNEYGVSTNTELTSMYQNFLGERPYWATGALHTHPYQFSRLYEPEMKDYSESLLNNAKSYSDVALVVLGRVTGESNDCPTVQYKGKIGDSSAKEDKTRTYLDISTEEEALLKYVASEYDKVIVIINSTNTMNLSFLDAIEGLDSCLIVGGTGNHGAEAIPKILFGEKNPSGRTVDTYPYDFRYNASFVNSGLAGVGTYLNTKNIYPATTTNPNVNDGDKSYPGASYLDYAEGIYVGYKWFETADAEGYWDDMGGYEKVVQFPFGHGLSYTKFNWSVLEQGVKDGVFTTKVRVQNTGAVAGQDVVQLYYTPPYTYGGLEKAAVNLCAIAKTHTVKPGEFEDLTLSFNITDMATYDTTANDGNGAYVLDPGSYEIKLMNNCHEVAPISRATFVYEQSGYEEITTDPASGKEIKNRFGADTVDYGIAVDGTATNEGITYLSRSDFEGTFPKTKKENRSMHKKLADTNLYSNNLANEWAQKHADITMPTTGAKNNMPVYNNDGKPNDIGLILGSDFDNEAWDQVLDQLTVNEMKNLVLHGYIKEQAIKSINKPQTNSLDGPAQIGSFNAKESGTGYSMPTVLGQTFNPELAYNFGLSVGKEVKEMNLDGWYAPGINLHRSPFGGRNFEYYSEDSFLSGILCANTVRGALNAGTYTYIKHFIGYDQESYRDGLYCWMTEQALREIYLKPYKIAIDNGATGIMTSYGRLGGVWSGGSEALLTELLRKEWDFKGCVLTDYSDHHEFMNGDQMLRAGGDLWMDGYSSKGSFGNNGVQDTSSAAFVSQLRTASKHTLYMILNAAYENSQYNESADVPIIVGGSGGAATWWIGVLVAFDVVAVGGCAALIFVALHKKREKKADSPAPAPEATGDSSES